MQRTAAWGLGRVACLTALWWGCAEYGRDVSLSPADWPEGEMERFTQLHNVFYRPHLEGKGKQGMIAGIQGALGVRSGLEALHAPVTPVPMSRVTSLTGVDRQSTQQEPPNIIFMFADNLGYGEVGVYGGNRAVPTPRIDALAAEGFRLTNFNVEWFCTPSRSATLTGRFGVRSGTHIYFRGEPGRPFGMTQWEITLAELLAPLGYTSALYGKWHLGGTEGRYPTDQGFDEWYGIRHSSSEAEFTSSPLFDPNSMETPYIWEGRKGEPSRHVKVFDIDNRRHLDRDVTERAVEFIERNTLARKPFFLFLPLTQLHFPTLAHPEFAGKTGAGDIGDAMAEMDRNVGVVLDAVKRLGIEGNTIVIWTSDGGAEWRRPWRGTSGPWRGFYATAMEGGIRVPFMIRWPGHIPAGRVSNEIVHQVDVFTTLARAAGTDVPQDRAIDGVNQLAFFKGQQPKSNRESFVVYVGGSVERLPPPRARRASPLGEIRAVKWRDWKMHYVWQVERGQPVEETRKLFNLRSDPKEETNLIPVTPSFSRFLIAKISRIRSEFEASLEKYPPIPPGTPDP